MRRLVVIGLMTLLAGCASVSRDHSPVRVNVDPRAVPVLDGVGGASVGWEGLVQDAASADVVFIGEMHGHAIGLAVGAALWEDVLAAGAGSPALSLEFFERDQQAHLDDYLTGVTDEATFRDRTNRRKGNYPDAHRAMVEAANAAGVPIYAANSPRRYTKLARTDGYERLEALLESQQLLFVTPDRPIEGDYRDRFFELFRDGMAEHSDGEPEDPSAQEEKIAGFYRAQSVWDATMADSIARALDDGHRPVVHVVGRFHADHDGGLVQRLRQIRAGVRIVTVSMSDGEAFTDEDAGRADYVMPVGPAPDH